MKYDKHADYPPEANNRTLTVLLTLWPSLPESVKDDVVLVGGLAVHLLTRHAEWMQLALVTLSRSFMAYSRPLGFGAHLRKKPFKARHRLPPLCQAHAFQVALFPSQSRQIFDPGKSRTVPVRIAALEGQQEMLVRGR